ncbi:MAG: S-methyl-5'-thioadenosine phosphorylase [Spirochaetia bacterium]|nr:S-methyl-5'-thioadenosine phosphorylase [Spirochaetia bacterium]
MRNDVKIAFIGGSGLYDLPGMKIEAEVKPSTPWGDPSDAVVIGDMNGRKLAFLARHGRGHFLNPSEVPSRANIAALKMLGVEEIIAFSAVGSLREEIAPRHFVLPSQVIDRTKGIRPSTYFEGGLVAHVMFGDPMSPYLADLIALHFPKDVPLHRNKTLVCMEGPAFSSRAESNMYRALGGDVINMSVLPEAKLARELEIAYQMVCMSTDYDSWREEHDAVTADVIIGHLHANADNARRVMTAIIPHLKGESPLKGSLKHAILTAPEKRGKDVIQRLNQVLPGYF